MRWIRSPVYDGFWILSAPAWGVALVLWPVLFQFFMAVDLAHVVSPILLAWTHRGYRSVMLERPRKFVGVPVALLGLGLGVAIATVFLFPDFRPAHMSLLRNPQIANLNVPLVLLVNLHAFWNLYHGGAQNFGLWCLYRRKGYVGRQRWLVLGGIVLVFSVTSYFGPQYVPALGMFLFGALSFNHSLAAIGLCGHVHGRSHNISPAYFIGCVALFGMVSATVFLHAAQISVAVMTFALSLSAVLRLWHFLQDKWLWKLSDPRVRATIGKELFA